MQLLSNFVDIDENQLLVTMTASWYPNLLSPEILYKKAKEEKIRGGLPYGYGKREHPLWFLQLRSSHEPKENHSQ